MDTARKSASPGYLHLLRSGKLEIKARALTARLASCDLCPRECGINRLYGVRGFCHSGALPAVSTWCPHHGEEPVLSGTRGSGTIFFGNCTMRCVYCQNYQISQDTEGSRETEIPILAGYMLKLQEMGCHNINLVSPTHFLPQIVNALLIAARQGLRLPLVYNNSGYDSLELIEELEGIIDIYLPDIRYASDACAREYSQAPGYPAHARQAIREMYRQVGGLELNEEGIAVRGLIVRHLILPNGLAGSRESLGWLAAELSPRVAISIMSQYYPAYRAREYPLLSRSISYAEYRDVVDQAEKLGLEEGWIQEMGAERDFLPNFREDDPFNSKAARK